MMNTREIKQARNMDWSKIYLLCLIVGFAIVAIIVNDRFATVENISTIFRQISSCGVVAVGMTLVILTGGIDLSIGYGMTMGAIVTAAVYMNTGSPWAGMAVGILACVILGIGNGLLITRVKIMPFITTLGTMSVARGVLNLIVVQLGGRGINLDDQVFVTVGSGLIGGVIPVSGIMMAVMLVVGALILQYTKLGSYVYAIGSNEANTKLAGIKTNRYKVVVYAISGLCMGIAAIIMGSRVGLVTQESGGNSALMECISAVVIGGTAVEGGRGDMMGTFLGVVFIGILNSLLIFLSIPSIAQDLFQGLIIIAALFLTMASKKIKEKPTKLLHTNEI